jgi:hypothetical protein
VKNVLNLKIFAALVLVSAGLFVAGCKSTPELTQANALAMIQAKYDAAPAAGVNITLGDQGMSAGVLAKYWVETKRYPNGFWGDFTLTPDGKKVVKLPGGGDVIQWHPETAKDPHYVIVVTSVATNHLKAKDLGDIQDEILPGVTTAKGASFNEAVNMDGLPGPLVDMAHNPGNKLSTKRQADFSFEDGAWKLHSVE